MKKFTTKTIYNNDDYYETEAEATDKAKRQVAGNTYDVGVFELKSVAKPKTDNITVETVS